MKNIVCLILCFLLLTSCGVSEEEGKEALKNSTNLGMQFFEHRALPELCDGNAKTGYIIFDTDGATIDVDMCGIKDQKRIGIVVDKILELAKEMNIKNRITITIYSRVTQTDQGKTRSVRYTSGDLIEKREIQ